MQLWPKIVRTPKPTARYFRRWQEQEHVASISRGPAPPALARGTLPEQ
ncbi:hypothetical protein [Streptomyces sp. NPDC008150]